MRHRAIVLDAVPPSDPGDRDDDIATRDPLAARVGSAG